MKLMSKELCIYVFNNNQNLYLLVVSNLQGWSIIKIKAKLILINNYTLYIYNYIMYIKTYISCLIHIFIGFIKNYVQYIKLKGMGYKLVVIGLNILIKLGFSHRALYLFSNDLRIRYLNKQLIVFENRSLYSIKKIIYMFQRMRKINLYKKKGFFFKGAIIYIKLNNKKSKV